MQNSTIKKMYIKLSRTKQSTNGYWFKKGSILEILSSYKNGEHDVLATKAVDEENLPYDGDIEVYSMKLDKTDFITVTESDFKLAPITAGWPGGEIEEDEDTMLPQLEAMYDDKDYKIDNDGLVSKKAGLDKKSETNNLADANTISQDDKLDAAGQNDPGVKDNYKEDTAEKPSTQLFSNPLAKKIQYKIRSLKKRLAETNNLAPKPNITQDDNLATDGAGTVKKDTYTADESTKEWNDKFLGAVSKKKVI